MLDIRVAEVVESDLRDASPFENTLQHIVDTIRRDGTAVGGREYILVVGLALLLPQDFDCLRRDADRPVGILGFQRRLHDFAIYPGDLPPHFDDAILPVNVRPFKSEKLTTPQTGCQLDVIHLIDTSCLCFLEECLKLLCRDGLHLLVLQLGERHSLAWILRDDLLRHGEVHGRRDDLIDIPYCLCRQPFRLVLRFDPFHPAFVHQLAVQLLKIHGTEFLQRDLSDVRCHMVVDVTPVGLVRGGANFNLITRRSLVQILPPRPDWVSIADLL